MSLLFVKMLNCVYCYNLYTCRLQKRISVSRFPLMELQQERIICANNVDGFESLVCLDFRLEKLKGDVYYDEKYSLFTRFVKFPWTHRRQLCVGNFNGFVQIIDVFSV